jgi:hypothetical protein
MHKVLNASWRSDAFYALISVGMQLSEIIYNPQLFVKLDIAAQQDALREHHIDTKLIAQLCSFCVTQTRTFIGDDHYIEYYNIDQAFFIQVPSR